MGGFFGVLRGQSVFQLFISIFVLLFFYTIFAKILKKVVRESRKAKAAAVQSRIHEGGLGSTAKDYIRRGKNKSAYGKISYSDK